MYYNLIRLIIAVLLLFAYVTADALAQTRGIWISPTELAALPTTGSAWDALKAAADKSPGDTSLSIRNNANALTVAKALVYARTGDARYRNEVINIVMGVIGTEDGGDPLAVWRRLGSYVIAADLVGLPADKEQIFRNWLRTMQTKDLGSRSVADTHEIRPNNWGTHAGGSRAAVAAYLGDTAELARTAQVFKGWLGDRASYAGFKYGDLSWQCDPAKPVGINPKGCTKQGHSIDGVLPDDQRRGGSFTWPPPKENYVWEALQGVLLQAVILYRAGYDVWEWEDRAILRAIEWLHNQANFPAEGDDTWQPHIINFYYGTNFPAPVPARPGKNMGWTDWTHAKGSGSMQVPPKTEGGSTGNWTDYRIMLTLQSQDNDALGIMFRYQDANNYYRFSWDRQRAYRRLVKRENGVFTLLAEDTVLYEQGQTYQVEIVALGTTLELWIDSTLIFTIIDTSFADGAIALYSWGNKGSHFDDVLVEDLITDDVLLWADFDDGDFSDWIIVDEGTRHGPSKWSATTGTLVQSSNIHSPDGSDIDKLGTYVLYEANGI